ncbi:MAG: type II toxin-antitoxin system VapC family toxin [Oscillatoriaceae cyanobacterium]
MIVVDTHIWIWWVQKDERLTARHQDLLEQYRSEGLGVSIFSCWEVAKLVDKQRLVLPVSVDEWLDTALAYPGVQLLGLTVPIVVQANQLPGFHNDPADQIIVATALIHSCPLFTVDGKIVNYPHVQILN